MLPTQALELAKGHDKYFELWRALLGNRAGATFAQKDVAQHFSKLGIAVNDLSLALTSVRAKVVKQRERAIAAKISLVPTFFVNGLPATGINRDERGLEFLIQQALQSKGILDTAKTD